MTDTTTITTELRNRLSNAERQRRWREKRNARAEALTGTPKEVAEHILAQLGTKEAKRLVRALDKRLRNIRPDCSRCGGSGFAWHRVSHACGQPLLDANDEQVKAGFACDCAPADEAAA